MSSEMYTHVICTTLSINSTIQTRELPVPVGFKNIIKVTSSQENRIKRINYIIKHLSTFA